ncbi:ABC transporter substrate-binding protein [uncultured Devosia sp.]|uniref:ABC transporter substrate-binding protein n=1 Tax=uncultured Devosia sp. TaxID=211434 RepID=UPI0035CBA7ED
MPTTTLSRRTALLLISTASALLLAAMPVIAKEAALTTANLAEPTAPLTITYAGAAYAPEDIQPVLDAFHTAHPNITVEYQSVPFAQFNSVLSTRLDNGDATLDVYDTDMPRTDAYAARGWLADLTGVFGDLSNDIDPGSIEAATVDGQLLAMPYQTSTNILYYNKTLLTAAGLDLPPADPAGRMTFEQLATNGKAAQEKGAKWGVLLDQYDRYYQLEPLVISAGGGPGGTGDGNLTPDVASAGWVKAMSWYKSLFDTGLAPKGIAVAETPDIFASGAVAYYVGGPWWAPKFEANADLDFGVAPFPTFEGGKPATPTGGWSLGLNPASEKKDAALLFMKFMGLDNGGYAQFMTALAVPPSNLVGAEGFYASKPLQAPRMAGVVDLIKYELANTSVLRLQTVGFVEFEDIIGRAFGDIINGADVQASLDGAASELADAWSKYQ